MFVAITSVTYSNEKSKPLLIPRFFTAISVMSAAMSSPPRLLSIETL